MSENKLTVNEIYQTLKNEVKGVDFKEIEVDKNYLGIKIAPLVKGHSLDEAVRKIKEVMAKHFPDFKVRVDIEGQSAGGEGKENKKEEAASPEEIRKVEDDIYELLKQVIDPEIGIDIINLGLIYNIVYDGKKHVYIEMTLSTPACPLSDALVSSVKNIIKTKYPDFDVDVELTFDPPWDTSMISEEGKRRLGMI